MDLNNDVKSIITKHLLRDYKISTVFMSKHQDLQKIIFGEIVFDNDFYKIKKIHAYVCMYVCMCVYSTSLTTQQSHTPKYTAITHTLDLLRN